MTFTDHFNKNSGKNRLKVHVIANIYHFGILNLNELVLKTDTLKKALETLQLVTTFLQMTSTRGPPYTFLGLYGTRQLACAETAKLFRSTFMPDAIVILGHLSFRDNNIHGCRIFPPNVYKNPGQAQPSTTYGHTFFEACEVAQCLREQEQIASPVSVSVTMKARTYKPLHPDPSESDIGNYDILRECAQGNYSQEMRPLSICDNSTYTSSLAINDEHQAVTAFNKIAGFTVVFDNSATLRQKVCEAKANLATFEFGLAVFDVNYDQGPTACQDKFIKGYGTRLEMIKKLSSYFRNEFNDASKLTGCISVG
ncbi:uncharacterized protein LOC144139550 [Haemaphysalis longicornis]